MSLGTDLERGSRGVIEHNFSSLPELGCFAVQFGSILRLKVI